MRKAFVIMLGILVATAAQASETFRIVDGEINHIWKADGWLDFRGKVSQVLGNGSLLVLGRINDVSDDDSFFLVKNFPNKVVDGDAVGESYNRPVRLKFSGKTFKYTTVLGATSTIRVLDYGIPSGPPLTPLPTVQETQAREAAWAAREKLREETAAKVLKSQQDRAAAGYPSSQYDLGLRYLKGDGVPKDEKLAREWLEKAAAQDHAEAKAALAKLQTHSNP